MGKIYRFFLFVFVLIQAITTNAQVKYAVEGRYKKLAAQGMAIFGDNAYILNNTGYCRVYDLIKKKVIGEYSLQCQEENNHANCATFGCETGGDNDYPLLYISQCRRPTYYCYVESVSPEGSQLLQKITTDCKGENGMAHDWLVDTKKKVLYSVTTVKVLDENSGLRRFHFVKFRLPKISEGEEVVLSDDDILDDFYCEYPNILQGGTIKGKYMYLPMGDSKTGKYAYLGKTLVVINLKKKRIEKTMTLDNLIEDEPEDCAFYKDSLYIFCGQNGGIHEIPLIKNLWDNVVRTVADVISNTLNERVE